MSRRLQHKEQMAQMAKNHNEAIGLAKTHHAEHMALLQAKAPSGTTPAKAPRKAPAPRKVGLGTSVKKGEKRAT